MAAPQEATITMKRTGKNVKAKDCPWLVVLRAMIQVQLVKTAAANMKEAWPLGKLRRPSNKRTRFFVVQAGTAGRDAISMLGYSSKHRARKSGRSRPYAYLMIKTVNCEDNAHVAKPMISWRTF